MQVSNCKYFNTYNNKEDRYSVLSLQVPFEEEYLFFLPLYNNEY